MKLYTRSEFLAMPAGTIYSKPGDEYCTLIDGLFCKMSSPVELTNDWVEQDLIGAAGFHDGEYEVFASFSRVCDKRDSGDHFETSLNCAGRDGCFDKDQKFVVWDNNDVKKLADFLAKTVADQSNSHA